MSDLEKNREFWIEIDGEPVRAREGAILGRLLERRGGLSMPCAGMGRCQGGFCGPRVHEILSRELGGMAHQLCVGLEMEF